MKCSACQTNACEGKFENKNKCSGHKEEIECTCWCQISKAEAIGTSAMSIGAGVAMAAGGVALTVLTGGLFAVVSGAALVGAGSSMVMNPIQKTIAGECMTLKDSATDVALGATIGAITGPIGSGASTFAKGASGLVKFGVRAGAGAAAGAVSGTVGETARYIKGEEVTPGSFAKAVGIGLVAGSVGGASTHVGSNLSKGVANGVVKAATRVSVQAASAAATDASLQYYDKGEIDTKQLMLTTVGQITVAATAEVSQNMSKRTEIYNKKINSELISENADKEGKKFSSVKLLEASEKVSSLTPEELKLNLEKASEYTQARQKAQNLEMHRENLAKINDDSSLSARQKQETRQAYIKKNNLPSKNTIKNINRGVERANRIAAQSKPERIGDRNIHALTGDRVGQFAIDLEAPSQETTARSGERALFEVHGEHVVYADHTVDHDYDSCRKNVKNLIPDPFDALRPEHINREWTEDDDNKSKEKTE